MKAVVQRVRQAQVSVGQQCVGQIGAGLLVLLCAERGDTPAQADQLLTKLLKLRIFSDAAGKMNHCVQDMDGLGRPESLGALLVVSQFTLAADTQRGNRPSFTRAALPEEGQRLYAHFVAQARRLHGPVQTGVFGADMQVSLINDGPVTLILETRPGH